MKKYYTISYWFQPEEDQEYTDEGTLAYPASGELYLSILDGKATVYTEDIIGTFDDEEDIKLTCLEVAQSRGYFPVLFEDDAVRYGRQGGKKSSSNLTPEQRKKRAQEAVKKRWQKLKKPNP